MTGEKNFLESVKKSVNREELLKTRRKESSKIRSKKNKSGNPFSRYTRRIVRAR